MNRRYREDQSKLIFRATEAERQRNQMDFELRRDRAELSRLKSENTRLELIETKLLHDKICLGRELLQMKYMLDFLQNRDGQPSAIVFRVAKAIGFR